MNEPKAISALLVEDNPADARLVELMLDEQGVCDVSLETRESLSAARDALANGTAFDVVLLDLSLPDSRGLDTLDGILPDSPDTPILIMTGLQDEAVALQAMHAGAQDYLVKGREDGPEIVRAIRYAMERSEAERERRAQARRLHEVLIDTVRAISVAFEKRDPYTAGHQHRVGQLAKAMGAELGWSASAQEGLYLGGLIHDIGKIALPADLLSRPGQLTDLELQLLRTHPATGYEIIEGVDFPWPIARMVGEHHERLDGSGYPHGLTGEAIAPEARVLAVADVVEAISSHRPYRPAKGLDEALGEIRQGRGTAYDAEAVDACLTLFSDKDFAFQDA